MEQIAPETFVNLVKQALEPVKHETHIKNLIGRLETYTTWPGGIFLPAYINALKEIVALEGDKFNEMFSLANTSYLYPINFKEAGDDITFIIEKLYINDDGVFMMHGGNLNITTGVINSNADRPVKDLCSYSLDNRDIQIKTEDVANLVTGILDNYLHPEKRYPQKD